MNDLLPPHSTGGRAYDIPVTHQGGTVAAAQKPINFIIRSNVDSMPARPHVDVPHMQPVVGSNTPIHVPHMQPAVGGNAPIYMPQVGRAADNLQDGFGASSHTVIPGPETAMPKVPDVGEGAKRVKIVGKVDDTVEGAVKKTGDDILAVDSEIDVPMATLNDNIVDDFTFEKFHKVDLSNLSDDAITKIIAKLPEVPEGRVDYSRKFAADLENFIPGTERLFSGKLTEDLYVINFHDKNLPIGFGEGRRTLSWGTHIEIGNRMPTINDVFEHLGLLREWGERNSVSLIKISKGTEVTFMGGKASEQISKKLVNEKFEHAPGGGYQIRFRDFDEKWIIETRELPK